jgi:hypothetical protein
MAEPQTEPTTNRKNADAANGEPDALKREGTHPTGEKQAEENRENDPPA